MSNGRMGILARLSWQLIRLRFSGSNDAKKQSNRLIFDNFKHLGGVYVKFLQILALNVDFMKGWARPSEFDVFEAVSYEEIDLAALLRSEIPNYEQIFTYIDPVPFAAGSFAQVYKGQLRDGTDVVLKILRPSLIRNLKSDLRVLGRLSHLSGWLYKGGVVDIRQVYRQFAATVKDEVNYLHEAQNAKWFYGYFSDKPDVIIPKTYSELSGHHIIVQEMIGGLSLAEVFKAQGNGEKASQYVQERLGSNIWSQLETLGTELLISTFTADYIIGDPHPGNIKLLPDNKIGLIDFGIAAPAPANRQAFLNLMREYEKVYADCFDMGTFTIAALRFFDEDLVQALDVAGQQLTPGEPQILLRKISEWARQTFDEAKSNPLAASTLDQKAMLRLFRQSVNEQNRLGIVMTSDAADMLKSTITFLEVIRSTGEYKESFPVIYHSLQRSIAFADSGQMAASQSKPNPLPEHALEFLSSWLSRIADKDPFLYRQITAKISL